MQSAQTTTSSFLALDSDNNLILTSSGTVVTVFVSASILNYTNPANNRLVTSVDSDSVNAEENLTFDGSVLSVTGILTSSVGLSSSLAQFSVLSSSAITDGTLAIESGQLTNAAVLSTSQLTSSHASLTNITATSIAGQLTTAAQPNITSVGNLTSLTSDSTTLVVKSTTSRVGIGRSGPQRKLDVFDGGGDPQFRVSFDASNFAELQTTNTGLLEISASGGFVGIGTATPDHSLTVAGNLSASVNVSASAFLATVPILPESTPV